MSSGKLAKSLLVFCNTLLFSCYFYTTPALADGSWNQYDHSLKECQPGSMILPSTDNDIFSYLFNNPTASQVTINVQGWQQGKCALTMVTAVTNTPDDNTRYCQLSAHTLDWLMDNIATQTVFNNNNALVTALEDECQAEPYSDSATQ